MWDKALTNHQQDNIAVAESLSRAMLKHDAGYHCHLYNNLALLLGNSGREAEAHAVWSEGSWPECDVLRPGAQTAAETAAKPSTAEEGLVWF
jgi:hypothetical protein